MRKSSFIRLARAGLLLFSLMLVEGNYGCERLDPVSKLLIRTNTPTQIRHNSCLGSGTIVDIGEDPVSQHGFCWSVTSEPTLEDDTLLLGPHDKRGDFKAVITSLEPDTRYQIRAFASVEGQNFYGKTLSFTTSAPVLPVVATDTSWLESDSTAIVTGHIIDHGGAEIIQKGICWGTTVDPTTGGSHTEEGGGTGPVSGMIIGLSCKSIYYFRVYATSSAGTGYGEVVSLQTPHCKAVVPEVLISPVSYLTGNSAQTGGVVTSDGGSAVLARGICWSITEYPDLSSDHTSNGSGTGVFTSSIVGLECQTSYYIRAYATNSAGTGYSDQLTFTTSSCPVSAPAVTTHSISGITDSSAISGGEITDNGGALILARGVCWSKFTDPDLSDLNTFDGTGGGSFTSEITGLDCNSRYYVRAYATNSHSTAYGPQLEFITASCPPGLAVVTTVAASSVSETSAECGGTVTDEGGAEVTERGLCWSESPGPTLDDSYLVLGNGLGSFTGTIEELDPFKTYYFRAYARNSAGIAYGQEYQFNTLWDNSMVSDFDGNQYSTIQIGDQVWMKENLNTTHYADGTPIPGIDEGWDTLKLTDPAFCRLNPQGDTYGSYYTWAAATNNQSSTSNPSEVQGVCPDGWHIPSDEEWKQLEKFLGMSQAQLDETHWRGTDQGGQLKVGGSSQFEGLLGGFRYGNGSRMNPGQYGMFWTSTEFTNSRVFYRGLGINSQIMRNEDYTKTYGLSVRCLKNKD